MVEEKESFKKRFFNLTISKKLILGFLAVIVLVLIISYVGYMNFNKIEEQSRDIGNLVSEVELAGGLEALSSAMAHDLEGYLLGMDEHKEEFAETLSTFKLVLRKIKLSKHKSAEERRLIDTIEKSSETFERLAYETMDLYDNGSSKELITAKLMELMPILHEIGEDSGKLLVLHDQELNQNLKEQYKVIINSINTFIIVTIIIIIVSLFIALFISRLISKPINKLAQTAEKVSMGDLNVNIEESRSSDEVGVLVNSFAKMLGNLKELVTQIRIASNKVITTVSQLSSSSQQVSASTQQTSKAAQQMAQNSQEQTKNIEETGKVINEMSDSVQQTAQNATSAVDLATKAGESAKAGGESGEKGVSVMNNIRETVINSATAIKSLGERSEKIGDIVNTITDISEQTNLLALNATIEAARAGDAGRGFAVVADEVRKLAEESGKAAEQINELVGEVQESTKKAVESMEISTKDVTEGSQVVTDALTSLKSISESTQNISSKIQEISAATQQQSAGSEQAVAAMNQVAATAEENAAATEEVSAATEEQTAAMEQVAASAVELNDMAESLKVQVSRFKIDKEDSEQTHTEHPVHQMHESHPEPEEQHESHAKEDIQKLEGHINAFHERLKKLKSVKHEPKHKTQIIIPSLPIKEKSKTYKK